jgi:hypothetical protein
MFLTPQSINRNCNLKITPKRVRKPSQRVLENIIHYNEIPMDDPKVFVKNAFIIMHNEPATYAEAMQRAESKRWQAAIEKS